MGPVNMMALEEYNECEQRYSFLTSERDDLLQSIADTQQAITELDLVSREKFEEAFAAINASFTEAFRTLFGGGTGEMRLTEADSSGDPGIDVVAQPPGKRLQNVMLLSGGEKALTALALLIAIFRYQPSPFCILDEVDAPLDEANVGRFADMVARMGAANAIHRGDAQSPHDGNGAGAVRRDHAGTGRLQAGVGALERKHRASASSFERGVTQHRATAALWRSPATFAIEDGDGSLPYISVSLAQTSASLRKKFSTALHRQ